MEKSQGIQGWAGTYPQTPNLNESPNGGFMPIESILKLAGAILLGIVVTHPTNFTGTLRKIEFSILREAADTRSWGNPSIFGPNRYELPTAYKNRRSSHKAI
jgi:hypothetical protein